MTFTILRRLQHSELGMFHAYRLLGKEGSKQRAINFDGDVVDRVFPSAKDTDKILIDCKYMENASTVATVQQWLKRQDKNWRFEGNCPKDEFYSFVEPNCLFAMTVDAGMTPAKSAWVVIPQTHQAYQSIMDHAESGGLDSAGMIALFRDECLHVRRVLGNAFPDLFEPVLDPSDHIASEGMEPHPLGLFTILANAGHDLPSAVADLVDNSISADATEITITFPNPNNGGRWMCIRDNGKGMTASQLRDAMRIGNPRQYEVRDLGRFGFGLKGASWSQADTLTVISKNSGETHHLTWDKSHLEKTGRWQTLCEPIPEQFIPSSFIKEASGTSVLLTNMRPPAVMTALKNVDPYNVEIAEVRDHLALVFHRFLSGEAKGRKPVKITINGQQVIPNNPVKHPLVRPHNPRELVCTPNVEGTQAVISLRAYVLPTEEQIRQHHIADGELAVKAESERLSLGGRMNANQGLYFYRLDRLIKWGGWCGVFAEDEHTKLLRVTVDFDRSADDPMKVNISKREIQLSVRLREAIKDAVKEGRTDARSRYDKKTTKKKADNAGNGDAVADPKEKYPDVPPVSGGNSGSPKTTSNPKQIEKIEFRILAMDKKWKIINGFFNDTVVEVSEDYSELVALVKSINGNNTSLKALADFLETIDGQPHG